MQCATLFPRHIFVCNLLTYVNNLTKVERKDGRTDGRTDATLYTHPTTCAYQLKTSMKEPNMLTYCALVVLVTTEFSASRCTGHQNIVLVDHEIRKLKFTQTRHITDFAFDK